MQDAMGRQDKPSTGLTAAAEAVAAGTTGRWLRAVSQFGLVSRAVVYLLVGYLTWRLAMNGGELVASLTSILTAAAGVDLTGSADIAIDGLAVMSFALVGVASVLAAHAMLRGAAGSGMVAR